MTSNPEVGVEKPTDLTGLNNRRGFLALAGHHTNLAYRTGKTFSIAFVDFDGLKRINDTLGH
jgi:diguanylate cyclase (GGDEF)-like protein